MAIIIFFKSIAILTHIEEEGWGVNDALKSYPLDINDIKVKRETLLLDLLVLFKSQILEIQKEYENIIISPYNLKCECDINSGNMSITDVDARVVTSYYRLEDFPHHTMLISEAMCVFAKLELLTHLKNLSDQRILNAIDETIIEVIENKNSHQPRELYKNVSHSLVDFSLTEIQGLRKRHLLLGWLNPNNTNSAQELYLKVSDILHSTGLENIRCLNDVANIMQKIIPTPKMKPATP